MADKALISTLTWRSLEMQKHAFPDMPHFVAPDDLPVLVRPTTRKSEDTIHVMSLGVIATKETEFREFVKQVLKRGTSIKCLETGTLLHPHRTMASAVVNWKEARKNSVAKVGGRISAAKREAESRDACDKIRDRWPLPSSEWRTPVLLKEVDISYNTAIKFLGKRPIAQYNHQAKLKRAAAKKAKVA